MCRQYSDQDIHGHASLTRWRSEPKSPRIEGQINLKCTKFTYGGYGGNMNNFKSRKECETWCLCPVAKCEKECEYGYRFDGSGCPTCECLGHPCAVRIRQECSSSTLHSLYVTNLFRRVDCCPSRGRLKVSYCCYLY